MIKNSSLGDRLNAFKKKDSLSVEDISPSQLQSNPVLNFIFTIFSGIMSIVRVFIFGYGLKIVFNTDWTFWSAVCIGLGANFLLTYIHDLIHGK